MSSSAATDSSAVSHDRSLTIHSEDSDSLSNIIATLKQKFPPDTNNDDSGKNLPVVYDFKNDISASSLLAEKFPSDFVPENYLKSRRELQYILTGFIAFALLSYIGFAAMSEINFLAEGNFEYNSGLIGGILMLIALLYFIVKRVTILRRLVSSDAWYYTHLGCGAVGAYLIVLHSSFELKSINSSIAFISMLVVIISGALGRYLYTQFTLTLHKRYTAIKDSEPGLFNTIARYECNTANDIRKRLSRFVLYCLKKPKDMPRFLSRCVSVIWYGVFLYTRSARDLSKIIKSIAVLSDLDKADITALKTSQMRQLRQYIISVIYMGYVSLLEQLFSHWRALHVPMLYLLVLTSIAHVVVVHMY
ncbi:MAG: hypothetical protein PVH04_05890 [Gammaproteobacteria bacterium]|jgi:hypothetical protein